MSMEKDNKILAPLGENRKWVVGLDFGVIHKKV
jgi:hypothetical protein